MQQSQAPVMDVQGLTKWFRTGGGPFGLGGEARYVHAVDDVTFALEKGRILALVGESGSGKRHDRAPAGAAVSRDEGTGVA